MGLPGNIFLFLFLAGHSNSERARHIYIPFNRLLNQILIPLFPPRGVCARPMSSCALHFCRREDRFPPRGSHPRFSSVKCSCLSRIPGRMRSGILGPGPRHRHAEYTRPEPSAKKIICPISVSPARIQTRRVSPPAFQRGCAFPKRPTHHGSDPGLDIPCLPSRPPRPTHQRARAKQRKLAQTPHISNAAHSRRAEGGGVLRAGRRWAASGRYIRPARGRLARAAARVGEAIYRLSSSYKFLRHDRGAPEKNKQLAKRPRLRGLLDADARQASGRLG